MKLNEGFLGDKESSKEMPLLDSLHHHVIQILLEWSACTLNAHLQLSSRCFPGGNKRKTDKQMQVGLSGLNRTQHCLNSQLNEFI